MQVAIPWLLSQGNLKMIVVVYIWGVDWDGNGAEWLVLKDIKKDKKDFNLVEMSDSS